MFTGLIDTVGTIVRMNRRGNYRVLSVRAVFSDGEPIPGESIAVDGACLTVVAAGGDRFDVEASQESAAVTIINGYTAGRRVNLERALKADGRLGGHFVSGHVDGTGIIDQVRSVGESVVLAVKFDNRHDQLVVPKGSIAINGVSLTVNECRKGWLNVNVIPFTMKETTLGNLRPGSQVNLEFDIIGKYVLKQQAGRGPGAITKEKLTESGW